MFQTASASTRRRTCARCQRPTPTCLCACIHPVRADVELLILQHPLEVNAAKGSARLLHLCVTGSRLVAGELFDQTELTTMLHAGARAPVLLYPETPDPDSRGIPPPPPLPPAIFSTPSRLRLVVLDGTWRKSRKMLYLNPALHGLPRLPLRAMPPSHYRIRKAHAPDQLSTLEASCHALAQIEGDADKFRPVLEGFGRFIDMLEKYQINHGRLVRSPDRS
jgi:DTW domain-containing protein YfiP